MINSIIKYASIIILCLVSTNVFSQYIQQVQVQQNSQTQQDSVINYWKSLNRASLDVSEVAFVNWNAGGSNSISGLVGLEMQRNFQKDLLVWENRLNMRYGVNKQEDRDLRKTDDILEMYSRFGFRNDTLSNWYFSANFSFKTQFNRGYKYSGDERQVISKFLAPAYMFLGVGTVYGEHIDSFSAHLSPLTLKATFVLDQALADLGSFGVDPAEYDIDGNRIKKGETSRKEVGILVTSKYEAELMENISMRSLVTLYTDYLNDFGNTDVDWEVNFNFRVNNYVRASFGSHLRYDNDIKTVVGETDEGETILGGARVQWKQLLGVGVAVDF